MSTEAYFCALHPLLGYKIKELRGRTTAVPLNPVEIV